MQLSNGDKISSTQEGDLKLSSQLPSTKATVLPHLTTSSLISLGKLCDEGCNISLNKETMQVQRNGNMVLQGYRNQNDGLWDIPVYNHPNPKTSIQPDNYILPPSHNIYKYDTINFLSCRGLNNLNQNLHAITVQCSIHLFATQHFYVGLKYSP